MPKRDPDHADFDLERFIDLFDEAMTSSDPRVVDTLRRLMMIVTLTKSESVQSGIFDRDLGPLRRMYEDINHLNRRLSNMESEVRMLSRLWDANHEQKAQDAEKYAVTAASQALGTQINQDVLNRVSPQIKGLYNK